MTKNFTPEDLIQFAYEEKDSFTEAQISHALNEDDTLRRMLINIERVQEQLDGEMKKPHPTSLKIILDYSRQSSEQLIN